MAFWLQEVWPVSREHAVPQLPRIASHAHAVSATQAGSDMYKYWQSWRQVPSVITSHIATLEHASWTCACVHPGKFEVA